MADMARKKRQNVHEEDLQGFKYFKLMTKMLQRLHDNACARDRAHNRILHMDQYMALLLMYMFNPVCESLRSLQEASELKKVQRVLGVPRASLGSLSEAATVFDAEALEAIIGELAAKLQPVGHDARLRDINEILTLVDGSWMRALPRMAWALFQDSKHRAVKAHVQFELLKGVPVAAEITDANTSEKAVLEANLQSGRLYVIDRGYAKYALLQAIIDADSSFVCRLPDNAVFEVVEERELSDEALAANVVRDVVVHLGGPVTKKHLRQPVRIVEVQCTPHRKTSGKTGRGGPEQGDTILIVTNRLDLPADVIALIYENRWYVEIFFRFFKHVLGCRNLISQNRNGIKLQVYAAIIACLLIALWTGAKPTKKTHRMVSFYLSGWADADEMQAHIDTLKSQRDTPAVA